MRRLARGVGRAAGLLVSLTVLLALLAFLVGLHTPLPGAVTCALDDECREVEPRVGAVLEAAASRERLPPPPVAPPAHVGAGDAAADEDAWEPATALPIRVSVESARDLRAWARSEGRERLREEPALDAWQLIMLGRFLAIDELVVRYSEHFGNDPLWLLLVMSAESALDPMARGPEPGDRGLGQVSFASEETAGEWVQDPRNPYYTPEFDPSLGIWSPRENIILASVVLRSIYAMPDVTTHDQAYARYTHGLRAVDDGRIARPSIVRVQRARSYEDLIRLFFAIAYNDPRDAHPARAIFDEAPSILEDPLIGEMLELDRTVDDGLPMYVALRDLYLDEEVHGKLTQWGFALLMREALTYTMLAEEVEGSDGREYRAEVRRALEERLPRLAATDDRALLQFAERTLAMAARDGP